MSLRGMGNGMNGEWISTQGRGTGSSSSSSSSSVGPLQGVNDRWAWDPHQLLSSSRRRLSQDKYGDNENSNNYNDALGEPTSLRMLDDREETSGGNIASC